MEYDHSENLPFISELNGIPSGSKIKVCCEINYIASIVPTFNILGHKSITTVQH